MATSFKLDSDGLTEGLKRLSNQVDPALRLYADTSALTLQNYAREHRRWTDRTGHARQRLTGTATKVVNGYKLTLSHGVDYGVWLELANEKKYAIIQPTILAKSNQIMLGFSRLLERLH